MSAQFFPHLPGILSTADLARTADSIERLQLDNGMIMWYPNGHCDPWNHVETAMALDVMGRHEAAMRAYRWLANIQREDGSWHNYYLPDSSIEEAKLDTNVCAYIATGLWHHWLSTNNLDDVVEMWPTVKRAMAWVLSMRTPNGLIIWAKEIDHSPWDYALLTGCSSIRHALHSGALLGDLLGDPQPHWRDAAALLDRVIRTEPDAFEPKHRWAMDWYYPVLAGALTGPAAKARLAEGWDTFVLDDRGVKCVSDEPWVTAAETAECAIAHCAVGDRETARELLLWTLSHRHEDGAYWTGVVYSVDPDKEMEHFPANERSSYTSAAIILAADAICATSPTSAVFTPTLGVEHVKTR